jgi:soluble lytic murein transglycosylase-like protein
MKTLPFIKQLVAAAALCLMAAGVSAAGENAGKDPWEALRSKLKGEKQTPAPDAPARREDPWRRLRAHYLPFTEEAEEQALKKPGGDPAVSASLARLIAPYRNEIRKASGLFNIPEPIIGAVILVESAGDPNAKARNTTASGLMQTIAGTYRMAREGLDELGIQVAECPFDPRSSILAGSWYLDLMFRKAFSDGRIGNGSRNSADSWKVPLEYYYAGPGNGRKEGDRVIVYRNGRRVVIDKAVYSEKVIRWAQLLARAGTGV